MRFCSLIVPVTVYLPNAVNDTSLALPRVPDIFALFAAAPLRKSVRRQPDVEGSGLSASVRVLVLVDVAGNRADATLARGRVVAAGATPTRRILVVDSNDLLAHDGNRVIHQCHVFGNFEARPRAAGCEGLADGIVGTTPRVPNRLECRATHRFGGRVNHRRGILGSSA